MPAQRITTDQVASNPAKLGALTTGRPIGLRDATQQKESPVSVCELLPPALPARYDTAFGRDVVQGLSKPSKRLPSKYFYDAAGSALFEQICDLPEYYPTRTETALMREIAPALAARLPEGAALVEYGSGASTKTRLLLDAAPQLHAYAPIDISRSALEAASAAIRRDYPDLMVEPVLADFTAAFDLPPCARDRPLAGYFPGSTIGNFTPGEATAFLARARRLLGAGARFILGTDLVKDIPTLIAAYDDAQGVTAAFNLNLLVRINRELDGDIDLAAFEHRAVWNAEKTRIEMHLVSLADQTVEAAGRRFRFARGETIHTENCRKFTRESIAAMAGRAGWRMEAMWVSPAPEFAVALLG
jgi:dimethylhistidine N-methyltransferase